MATRLLVQLAVMGSGMLGRAFVQAYRQALSNASKSGIAQETLQNVARKGTKNMTEKEARLILGVSDASSFEEILQKYNSLFENNHKNGSFYLQSKVQRAKELLEEAHQAKGQSTNV